MPVTPQLRSSVASPTALPRTSPFAESRRGPWRDRLLLVGALVLAACGDRDAAPVNDTAAPIPPPRDSAPPVRDEHAEQAALWGALGAGEVIAVPAVGPERARLLRPQAAADWRPAAADTFPVDLVRAGGALVPARLVATDGSDWGDCAPGEAVRVIADRALPPWQVAFARGAVRPIPLDSLPALSSKDSATRTQEVARVAAALKDDTAEVFRRVPFVVRVAHRFPLGRGSEGMIAEVRRRLGQEARPREERLILIMERSAGGEWREVFHERLDGAEDAIGAWQVLAVARLGAGARPAAIIAFDDDDGIAVDVVVRGDDGRWTRGWSSGVECGEP